MNQVKKIIIYFIFIFNLFSLEIVKSQSDDCKMSSLYPSQSGSSSAIVGGLYKPHRSDLSGGVPITDSTSRLNVLAVFVQFANESLASNDWPIGGRPNFMDSVLSPVKRYTGDYWNKYSENSEKLSDWFQEVSRGKMHVTGKCVNIVLDHTDGWYFQNGGMATINIEIYTKLKSPTFGINWLDYDRWDYDNGQFYYQADDYIDMIFKVHRHTGDTNMFDGGGGYAYLGGDAYMIDSVNTKTIRPYFGADESGLTIVGTVGGPCDLNRFFGIVRHEYGHYLFGSGHNNYGVMGAGDIFLSPLEMIKLGYQTPQTVNYNYKDYSLLDFSSRSSSGEVLIVPINMPNEFFLISNRRKVSKYDVLMLGDTGKGDFQKYVGDYGKGVYIDHIVGGLNHPSAWDIECADGLWNWVYKGQTTPDWSSDQQMNIYEKSNMTGAVSNDNGVPTYYNKDGRSFGYVGSFGNVLEGWFSRGKRHTSIGGVGVDRIFTNDTNFWTSRTRDGDRWDPWNIGYNNIFSPYSNPNTKNWNSDHTGIFIYYESLSGGTANLKIFRTDSGGYTETQILAQTPPSKPTGIVVDYFIETENYVRPLITWNHNKEPDMLSDSLTKRYKIWRATATNMNIVPTNYTLLKTLDIDSGTVPGYLDTSIKALGSAWPGMGEQIEYPVRYTVQAIDKYEDSSVRSDFGSIIGLMNCFPCTIGERIQTEQGEIPDNYKLYENYPNPFNPETKIKFDLPIDNYVTIKVYDILGKEIFTLVNEFKQAGRYVISFNGNNLSSGIYYYKIKAGSFEKVRKMILLK